MRKTAIALPVLLLASLGCQTTSLPTSNSLMATPPPEVQASLKNDLSVVVEYAVQWKTCITGINLAYNCRSTEKIYENAFVVSPGSISFIDDRDMISETYPEGVISSSQTGKSNHFVRYRRSGNELNVTASDQPDFKGHGTSTTYIIKGDTCSMRHDIINPLEGVSQEVVSVDVISCRVRRGNIWG